MFRIYVQLSHFPTNNCTTNSIPSSIITVRHFLACFDFRLFFLFNLILN